MSTDFSNTKTHSPFIEKNRIHNPSGFMIDSTTQPYATQIALINEKLNEMTKRFVKMETFLSHKDTNLYQSITNLYKITETLVENNNILRQELKSIRETQIKIDVQNVERIKRANRFSNTGKLVCKIDSKYQDHLKDADKDVDAIQNNSKDSVIETENNAPLTVSKDIQEPRPIALDDEKKDQHVENDTSSIENIKANPEPADTESLQNQHFTATGSLRDDDIPLSQLRKSSNSPGPNGNKTSRESATTNKPVKQLVDKEFNQTSLAPILPSKLRTRPLPNIRTQTRQSSLQASNAGKNDIQQDENKSHESPNQIVDNVAVAIKEDKASIVPLKEKTSGIHTENNDLNKTEDTTHTDNNNAKNLATTLKEELAESMSQVAFVDAEIEYIYYTDSSRMIHCIRRDLLNKEFKIDTDSDTILPKKRHAPRRLNVNSRNKISINGKEPADVNIVPPDLPEKMNARPESIIVKQRNPEEKAVGLPTQPERLGTPTLAYKDISEDIVLDRGSSKALARNTISSSIEVIDLENNNDRIMNFDMNVDAEEKSSPNKTLFNDRGPRTETNNAGESPTPNNETFQNIRNSLNNTDKNEANVEDYIPNQPINSSDGSQHDGPSEQFDANSEGRLPTNPEAMSTDRRNSISYVTTNIDFFKNICSVKIHKLPKDFLLSVTESLPQVNPVSELEVKSKPKQYYSDTYETKQPAVESSAGVEFETSETDRVKTTSEDENSSNRSSPLSNNASPNSKSAQSGAQTANAEHTPSKNVFKNPLNDVSDNSSPLNCDSISNSDTHNTFPFSSGGWTSSTPSANSSVAVQNSALVASPSKFYGQKVPSSTTPSQQFTQSVPHDPPALPSYALSTNSSDKKRLSASPHVPTPSPSNKGTNIPGVYPLNKSMKTFSSRNSQALRKIIHHQPNTNGILPLFNQKTAQNNASDKITTKSNSNIATKDGIDNIASNIPPLKFKSNNPPIPIKSRPVKIHKMNNYGSKTHFALNAEAMNDREQEILPNHSNNNVSNLPSFYENYKRSRKMQTDVDARSTSEETSTRPNTSLTEEDDYFPTLMMSRDEKLDEGSSDSTKISDRSDGSGTANDDYDILEVYATSKSFSENPKNVYEEEDSMSNPVKQPMHEDIKTYQENRDKNDNSVVVDNPTYGILKHRDGTKNLIVGPNESTISQSNAEDNIEKKDTHEDIDMNIDGNETEHMVESEAKDVSASSTVRQENSPIEIAIFDNHKVHSQSAMKDDADMRKKNETADEWGHNESIESERGDQMKLANSHPVESDTKEEVSDNQQQIALTPISDEVIANMYVKKEDLSSEIIKNNLKAQGEILFNDGIMWTNDIPRRTVTLKRYLKMRFYKTLIDANEEIDTKEYLDLPDDIIKESKIIIVLLENLIMTKELYKSVDLFFCDFIQKYCMLYHGYKVNSVYTMFWENQKNLIKLIIFWRDISRELRDIPNFNLLHALLEIENYRIYSKMKIATLQMQTKHLKQFLSSVASSSRVASWMYPSGVHLPALTDPGVNEKNIVNMLEKLLELPTKYKHKKHSEALTVV